MVVERICFAYKSVTAFHNNATAKKKKPRQNKKVTAKPKSHFKTKKPRQNEKAAAK